MPALPFPENEKFLVAFSLAGEQRHFVRAIAEAVGRELGSGTVFFDEWFEHHLGGGGGDLKLQRICGEQSILAVYCVSNEHGRKPWTLTEHEAFRAIGSNPCRAGGLPNPITLKGLKNVAWG